MRLEIGFGAVTQMITVPDGSLVGILEPNEVEISLKTDPSLIGGFYVHVDGRLMDRTVKKYFSDLKDHIKKGVFDDQQA